MKYYLISFLILEEQERIINAGTIALKSTSPKTIRDIDQHMQKFYAGSIGVAYITNIQRISEDEFDEYGGHEEIS